MAVTYKDIDQLSQKSSVVGTEKLPVSDTEYITPSQIVANDQKFYFVDGSSSQAGNSTSGSYLSTKWEGTIPGVTTLVNGLKIAYRIATNTGVATAGAVLSIDGGTTYKPVVFNVNSVITTRYSVGSTILCTYNATQTASAYLTSNKKTTITGCWQIMDYDANTNTQVRQYQYGEDADGTSPEYPLLARYALTNKNGSYDTNYSNYHTGATLNTSTGGLTATSFKKSGGTSGQFLKADGSVDGNSYALASAITPAPGTLDTTATTAQSTSASESLSGSVTLHKVAKTGTYSDLIGKPTIPSAPGTLNTTATSAQSTSSSEALSGSITLHKVSKTGSYNDLNNKPTIPSAPGTLITNATTAQTASSGEAMTGSITLHKVSKTGTYSDLVGTPTVDTAPTASSSNLVSSGGVYTALQGKPNYTHLTDESEMPASPDASTLYLIDDDGSGGNANIVHLTSESEMPASPDPDTLYVINESAVTFEQTSNKVTSLSSSSTDTQYPSAKCVYDLLGDIETLLTALL